MEQKIIFQISIARLFFVQAFLILQLVFLVSSQGFSQEWTENWENPNWVYDWQVTDGTWEVGQPASGPNSAFGGLNCAATILDGNYPANTSSQLIRNAAFLIPAASQNPRLRFWHWYSFANGYGKVQIREVGTSDWIDISPGYWGYCGGIWTYPSIDLTPYANKNVQLAFYFEGGYWTEAGWYIDDISLVTGPSLLTFPEGFEAGLGNWYAETGTWEVGAPTSGPNEAHSGQNCAATILTGNYASNTSSNLISPTFTVPAASQNPRLRFWHWYSFANGYGKVRIREVGTSDWTDISPGYWGYCGGIWTYPSIDLTPYANKNVQLAFYFEGGYWTEAGWYIDDLALVTGPSALTFPEGFEAGLGNWYAETGTWEVGVPTSGPNEAHSGQNCAATILTGNYASNTSSNLISPTFTVPAASQNPRLRFWHWYSFANGYGKVRIREVGTSDWIDISPGYWGYCGGIWTYPSIDLTPFTNKNVQLAFYFEGGYWTDAGWYIDDLALVTGPSLLTFPEGFEAGLGNWYAETGTWEVGVPTSGLNSVHSGQNCAATILTGNYASNTSSKLISPAFTVPSESQNPSLTFWHWYSFADGYGIVRIREVGTSEWSDISPGYGGSCGWSWTQPTIDLTPYANKNVQIAFYFEGGYWTDAGWYIDDISITANPLPYLPTAVTFTVDMSTCGEFNPETDTIYLSGDFPDASWNEPGSNPALKMERIGLSHIYSVTLQLEPGTYSYKYYRKSGWAGGEWDGDPNRVIPIYPAMTIEDTWGGVLNWYNLQSPGSGTIGACDDYYVTAYAHMNNNKTGQGIPAPGLQAWIGFSLQNTHPATWTNWVPAPYAGAAGSSDEFKVNLGKVIPYGNYYYASRFKLGNNNYVYGGFNGGSWDYSNNISGNVTVIPTIIPTIAGNNFVCNGASGVTYMTESGMESYTWTVSSGGVITAGASTNTITVTWNSTGTQTVSVKYNSTDGCSQSVTSSVIVMVNPRPVPVINGISSVCAGTTGITYTTEPGMTGYFWTIPAGGSLTSGSGTNAITVAWNTPGAQSVSLICTNAYGCTPAIPSIKNVTVHSRPSPTISGSVAICAGSAGILYTTEAGMTGYQWAISSGGTITSGSGTNAITVSWNTAGAQTLSVSYTNSSGCAPLAPTVKNVTVNPRPLPVITGSASVCAGSAGVSYNTEFGMTSYNWTISTGGIITSGNGTYAITVIWNTAGNQSLSVSYTNANGCIPVAPAVKNVTVNARPVPSISGSSVLCAGSTEVTYSTEPGMTGYSWIVSNGGSITSGSGTNSIKVTWNTAGSQNVNVSYTNTNGCSPVTPTIKNITVNPRPVPTISGPSSVCSGSSGVVYSTEQGMTGYLWIVSQGGQITGGSGTNAITVTWNTPGSQTVSVDYANSGGCTPIASTLKNITVNTFPGNAQNIIGQSVVTQGQDSVIYTIPQIENATGYNWILPPGAEIIYGNNTNTVFINFSLTAQSGALHVRGSNSCGFGNISPDFNITVNPLVAQQVSLTNLIVGSAESKCYNATQTITIAGNGTMFFVLGGGSATFIAGHNILFKPGTYLMYGSNSHGYITNSGSYCGENQPSMVMNPLNTDENILLPVTGTSIIRIFPNPTTGKFFIDMPDNNTSPVCTVQIFNLQGVMVLRKELIRMKTQEISIEHEPRGTYIVKVVQDNNIHTAKVVKL